MPQDFGKSEEIGGFASAVTEAPGAETKPPVQQEATKQETVIKNPPVEETKVPAKEEKTELSNPNLGEKKEPPKEDDEAIPAGMTKPAQETWKKIKASEKQARTERDEAKKEADDIRKQMAESGKTAAERDALKKELDDAKARISEYDQEISIHRVEMSAPFKKNITAPLKEISESVKALATKYEVAPETLLRAIQEPDADRRVDLLDEVTTDMKRPHQIALTQAATDFHRLQRQAEEMRADASKTLEEITRKEKEDGERASTKTIADYRASVKSKWDGLMEKIPEIRKVDGNEPWNSHLDSLRTADEAIDVNDLPVEEVADMAAHRRAMPEILSVMKHFKTENATLKTKLAEAEARIKDMRAVAPGAGAGGNGNGEGAKQDSRSFSEAVFATA
jgi:hypothetical protein